MNSNICGICLQTTDCFANVNDVDENEEKWLTKLQFIVPQLDNSRSYFLCNVCIDMLDKALKLKTLLLRLLSRQKYLLEIKEDERFSDIDFLQDDIVISCKTCLKSVTKERELQLHKLKNHGKTICGKSKIEFGVPLTCTERTKELDDLLKCVDCNVTFSSETELHHHLCKTVKICLVSDKNGVPLKKCSLGDNSHTSVKYQCENCNEWFNRKSLLSSHIKSKQCKESINTIDQHEKGPFICKTCNNFYTSEKNLSLHKLYCDKQDSDSLSKQAEKGDLSSDAIANKRKSRRTIRTFTCEICSEKFNYIKVALDHYVVQHSIDKKSIKLYACDICNQRFSSSTNLQKHHKYHEKHRSKICSICGKSFITKSDLMVHEYTHYNRRNYKCGKCNKAFNTNKNFWTHNLVVHTDPSQWKHVCNVCDKRFPLKASYDQHVKRHNGEKKFSCHICSKSFISRSEVKRHVDLHSNIKKFKCSYCDKEYKYDRTLKTHISTVHDKAMAKTSLRQKNFVCHICPRQFYDKQKLARHLCGHTGVKPFPCELCDRKFTDKSYLKYHLKIVHKIFEQNQ